MIRTRNPRQSPPVPILSRVASNDWQTEPLTANGLWDAYAASVGLPIEQFPIAGHLAVTNDGPGKPAA